MKNLLLFFISFFICTNYSGQTLTQAFNEPVIGEVDKNYRLDTSAYSNGLPNNITGTNVTWDFTMLAGAFPILIDSLISPSAAPSASDFPQSSYVIRRGTLNTFYKSSTAPAQTEILGFYSPTLTLTFTNTAILLQYPVSYGYSYSDVISGTYKTGSNTGAVNGNINVVADGLGTLNLPDNVSFQNVLRIKSVEQVTLSTAILPLGTIKQTIFSYFAPGKKYPVIYVQYNTYQFLAGTPIITIEVSGDFDYFYVVGLKEQTDPFNNLRVAPNPFSDKIQIVGYDTALPMNFRLLGLDGQLLLEAENMEALNNYQLASGIYLLEISEGSKTCFKKIVRN